LGDNTSDLEDQKNANDVSDEIDAKLNESLLDDGVSLKTEDDISEEVKEEAIPKNKSPEQSGTE